MTTLSASQAQAHFFNLIDQASKSHEPVLITGEKNNVILVSEEDWRSIQETLHLLSIPGMRESIREGLRTPLEDCSAEISW